MNAARHEKCRSRNSAARCYASYCGNFVDGAQSQDISCTPTRVKVCFTLPFHYVLNVDTLSLTISLTSIKLSQYFSQILEILPGRRKSTFRGNKHRWKISDIKGYIAATNFKCPSSCTIIKRIGVPTKLES